MQKGNNSDRPFDKKFLLVGRRTGINLRERPDTVQHGEQLVQHHTSLPTIANGNTSHPARSHSGAALTALPLTQELLQPNP